MGTAVSAAVHLDTAASPEDPSSGSVYRSINAKRPNKSPDVKIGAFLYFKNFLIFFNFKHNSTQIFIDFVIPKS
jgi:hypothetical protein